MKIRYVTSVLLLSFAVVGLLPSLLSASQPPLLPAYGGYNVYVQQDGAWHKAGRLAYREHMRSQSLSLSQYASHNDKTIKVRIEQTDGGEAHIDSVLLGGHPALTLHESSPSLFSLTKLSVQDRDLYTATRQKIELEFASSDDMTLSLTARVEFMTIAREPFRFPQKQGYLRYQWDEKHQARVTDGQLTEKSGSPFLRQWSVPQSGHPAANTFAWVSNDKDYLYIAVDFLSDNTPDPGKDYAAVLVKTDAGVRRFEISQRTQGWGRGAFTYTAQATYQHKAYEFKIPRTQLPQDGSVQLALETYGTASQGMYAPTVAWDSKRNRYMVLYSYVDPNGAAYLQTYLAAADGVSSGTSVTHDTAVNAWGPFDTDIVYNRVNDQYFVVYRSRANSYLYGLRFDGNGNKIGSRFVIGNSAATARGAPQLAYDAVTNRYLVVWHENRGFSKIWGQLVNADGTLYATSSTQNVLLAAGAGGNTEYSPAIATNTVAGNFVITWDDSRGGVYTLKVYPDGSTAGVEKVISAQPFVGSRKKGLAFDPLRQRYLAAFSDNRYAGSSPDVFGQFLDNSGAPTATTAGANFPVALASAVQTNPVIAYNATLDKYLVAWSDTRLGNGVSHGQLVEGSGAFSGTNFSILASQPNEIPALTANDGCGNWLMVAQIQFVGPKLVTDVVGPPCTPPAVTFSDNSGVVSDRHLDLLTDVGQTANGTVQIFNSGGWPVQILAVSTSGAFAIKSDGCTGGYLFGGNGCAFQVQYAPVGEGKDFASVLVQTDDASTGSLTFTLSGTASFPAPLTRSPLTLSPGTLALEAPVSSVTTSTAVTLSNTGDTAQKISVLTGLSAESPFSVTRDSCGATSLAPKGSCTFAIAFAPHATGTVTAVVQIAASDPLVVPVLLRLSGQGLANLPPPAPQLVAPPDGSKEVPLTVALAYLPVSDPEGDALTYQLYLCDKKDFAGCEPQQLEAASRTSMHPASLFAIAPWMLGFAGLLGFRRQKLLVWFFPLLLSFSACQSLEPYGPPFIPKAAQSQQVSGLKPDTDYYWKVLVSDGLHKVESEVWTFRTVAD